MGKTRKLDKNKRTSPTSIILVIISIIVFATLSYFSFNNYKQIIKIMKKNKEFEAELNNLKNDHITYLTEQTVFEEKIAEFDTLDEQIATAKEETFKLASELENKILNNETSYKIAYITFDDGPYHMTDEVLRILKENDVKATFFTIGEDKEICYDNHNYSCSDTYQKIVEGGHTIANHTYSHGIFRGLYSSADSFIYQVKRQEELIKDKTGVTTNILRFPGGEGTARSLLGNGIYQAKEQLTENGYGWVDWTAQDGDGGYVSGYSDAWGRFTGSINENIEVILFHDYSTVTLSILQDAINYLKERNYVLLPLFYDSVKINK